MKYNNKTYSAKGIGDMTFGFSFLQNIAEGFTGITRFKVSVPTGDENARDEGFRVPLGSGGYSLSLLQSFSKMLDPLRLFGSLGFIFFLQSEYTYGPILYTVEKSPIYNLMLGTEYWFLQSFSLLLKANLIMVSEGRIKATGTRWVDLNDSLTTSDIIPGIKYHIIRNVLFTYLMFVLPVYTKHDSDLSNKPDRKWGLDFGVTGLF